MKGDPAGRLNVRNRLRRRRYIEVPGNRIKDFQPYELEIPNYHLYNPSHFPYTYSENRLRERRHAPMQPTTNQAHLLNLTHCGAKQPFPERFSFDVPRFID